MIPIPYLAVARFTGEEAGEFLQSQLSADIAGLEPGAACFACYCTPQGKVLGLLRVQRNDDEYRVAGARALMPSILQRLKMYVFRTRVAFEAAEDLCVFGEPGPDYRFEPCASAAFGDATSWKMAELESGIAWLGEGSTERFIPQMLGFDRLGAVSFNKGCYPGQEIVARARYLGKVKRGPVLVRVTGLPEPAPGGKIGLQRSDSLDDGVVVDAVQAGDVTLVLAVTRHAPEHEVGEVVYDGTRYFCATT